ncbi:hypothetical protein Tco_1089472 [Tanacetum coccineum]
MGQRIESMQRTTSSLFGRAEVSWKGVFESPNMEMERCVMMKTKNKDVKAPSVRIVMKIETPNGVALVERKKNKWDESRGGARKDFKGGQIVFYVMSRIE